MMREKMPPDIEVNISGEGGDDALSPETNGDQIEEITDAAVSVAEIQAAAEITVAQIEADTSLEHHRIEAAMQTERTELQWQELLTRAEAAEALTLSLTAELEATRAELQALIPPPSLAAEATPEAAQDQGPEVIPAILEMTPEPESVADANPAAPSKPRRVVRFL